MALTNLEFCHIRIVGKARQIVDRRRLSPMTTSLSMPAFFDLVLSDRAKLITYNERNDISDKIYHCDYSNDDENVKRLMDCMINRLSVYALYPDKSYRKKFAVKRSYGAVPSVPVDERTLDAILGISLMSCEYLSIMKTIARSSRWFEE